MLVLSRRIGEKIWIGEDICITIIDVDRSKVRVGIAAPMALPVYREELVELTAAGVPAIPFTVKKES